MDFTSIITAVGASGILSGLFTWLSNRRIARAQAKQADEQANITNADYAQKIIEQSDKRVEQALDDTARMRVERDKWQEECRGQRKAKQEWRARHEEAISRIHGLELENKDKDAKLVESKWHECRREDHECSIRIPPRKREQK